MKILIADPKRLFADALKITLEGYGYDGVTYMVSTEGALLELFYDNFDLYLVSFEIFEKHKKIAQSLAEMKEKIIITFADRDKIPNELKDWNISYLDDDLSDLIALIRTFSNVH